SRKISSLIWNISPTETSFLCRPCLTRRRGIQYRQWFRHSRGHDRGLMRVLFVASEGLPYSKTGGLADVIEALPKALVRLGHEVAVFLPRYRGVKASTISLPSVTIAQGTRLRFPAISNGSVLHGVRYFFLEDPAYFDR